MKKYVLWVRHCESCSNVVVHSKYKKRWFTDRKQGFETPPNCTVIGLIQSFMFGYTLLPKLLKLYPQFKKVEFYCSLLKRTMITNKLISHGLKKSNYKIKTSKDITRMCNVSEKPSLYEKIMRKEFNRVSLETSDNFRKQVNKTFKKTGKKISRRIKKKTKNCNQNDHKMFMNETLPKLKSNSLNLIVSHGIVLRKIFKLKGLKNVDGILAEYDTTDNSFKVLEKIQNKTDLSDDKKSHKRIKDEVFKLHYQSDSIDLKTAINMDEFTKFTNRLKIDFDKRDNEITCDK
jgi:hypothetical protein